VQHGISILSIMFIIPLITIGTSGIVTMSCDWKVEDVTAAKIFKQSCQSHALIIDETTIVLLESLADPHSNGIEIKFLSEGLPSSNRVTLRRSTIAGDADSCRTPVENNTMCV
jgi:hypothetical protein